MLHLYHISMKIFQVLCFICLAFSGFSQKSEVISAKQLISQYSNNNDTTYVVNFWATWCKPCIEELPFFLKLEKEMANEPVKFIFVSLDDSKHIIDRVNPFIKKMEINNVFVLDDKDPNDWIPEISNEWTGSIPATLIIKNQNENFYEQKFNYDQLKKAVLKTKGTR